MRARIAESAKASGRSMNAEIIARLQSTLDREDRPLTRAELDAVLAERDADMVLRLRNDMRELAGLPPVKRKR